MIIARPHKGVDRYTVEPLRADTPRSGHTPYSGHNSFVVLAGISKFDRGVQSCITSSSVSLSTDAR